MLRGGWQQHVLGEVELRELFLPQVYDLYDAMMAWMGPGGDQAFLEFYLLSAAKLPPMVIGKLADWKQRPFFWREFGRGITEGHRTAMRSANRGFFVATVRDEEETLREVRDLGLDSCWQAVPMKGLLFPMTYGDSPPQDMGYNSVWAPLPSYRTDLMGELAQPWPCPATIPMDFIHPPRVVRRP